MDKEQIKELIYKHFKTKDVGVGLLSCISEDKDVDDLATEMFNNLYQHLVSKSALDKPKKKNFKHNHKVCGCGRPYSQKDLEDGMCNKCYAPTM